MDEIILGKLNRIEAKLDAVIKALHEYDDANIEDINEGYGESSFESFMDSKDDILNWKVDGTERRIHHVTNEEADEDANNNTQGKDKDKHVGETKKRNKRKYYKPKNKG
jgi:vacuolar-type H+-ATPase subunit I/STV1